MTTVNVDRSVTFEALADRERETEKGGGGGEGENDFIKVESG